MTTRFFGDCPATAVSSLDHADSVDARLPLLPDDLTIHYDEAAQPRGLGGRAGINASFPYPNLVRIRARAKTFFADVAAKSLAAAEAQQWNVIWHRKATAKKRVGSTWRGSEIWRVFCTSLADALALCASVANRDAGGAVGAPTGAKARRHGSRLAAASERRALGHVVARGAAHR